MKKLTSTFVLGLVGMLAAAATAVVEITIAVKNYKDRDRQTRLHAETAAKVYANEQQKYKHKSTKQPS